MTVSTLVSLERNSLRHLAFLVLFYPKGFKGRLVAVTIACQQEGEAIHVLRSFFVLMKV